MNIDMSQLKPEEREGLLALARLEEINRMIDAELSAALALKMDREIMGAIQQGRAGR